MLFISTGIPVSVKNINDGTELTKPVEMFTFLNKIAGRHGIGRIDIVENRFVGLKVCTQVFCRHFTRSTMMSLALTPVKMRV